MTSLPDMQRVRDDYELLVRSAIGRLHNECVDPGGFSDSQSVMVETSTLAALCAQLRILDNIITGNLPA